MTTTKPALAAVALLAFAACDNPRNRAGTPATSGTATMSPAGRGAAMEERGGGFFRALDPDRDAVRLLPIRQRDLAQRHPVERHLE